MWLSTGSVEVINKFNARTVRPDIANKAPDPFNQVSFNEVERPKKLQWFPESNKVEWSITLRPNVPTVPVRIDSLSEIENSRVLFYIVEEDRDPILAAQVYIRSKDKAVIKLPAADYRLDVISTPVDMVWDIAKDQYASPRFKLAVETRRGSIISQMHLELGDGGNIRRYRPQSLRRPDKFEAETANPDSSDAQEPAPTPTEPAEVDYGALEMALRNSARPET